MNKNLDFNIILEKLANLTLSQSAKNKAYELSPFLDERKCKSKIKETTEAKMILEKIGSPPLVSMTELAKTIILCQKGSMLTPEQLTFVSQFINSCKRMKKYLKKSEALEVSIAFFGNSLIELDELFDEIDRSIKNNMIDDGATLNLRNIRRKIENTNLAIKSKLENILRGKKEYFADAFVATRGGRFVLPVKKEYKNQVPGSVMDTSGSGNTYFIEPSQVKKLVDELNIFKIDEDNEIRKILYTLSALVEIYIEELKLNIDCMETLDFVFAKAKLSLDMKSIEVPINSNRKIIIKNGRHPLLKPELCVPLDFNIGDDINGVIITGPNTGGKTVALKTVGLLSLMAQSGLHVPVSEGSEFCLHSNILSDIGDGQSISENLSTFSSHITNIIKILENTTDESLILLDELGSGTDPAEGMGIAISILAELKQRNCLFVATTHYPEIKDFSKNTDGLINARMAFDRESLKPLYKLEIGEAGESCALYIAKRLGFPLHMLKRASFEAYKEKQVIERDFIQFEDDSPEKPKIISNKIQKEIFIKPKISRIEKFDIGDSVKVYPEKHVGIIFKLSDEKGNFVVQIKNKKQIINHKRLKLLTKACDLYPDLDTYDLSIVFDTVENRKARHIQNKKHDADVL